MPDSHTRHSRETDKQPECCTAPTVTIASVAPTEEDDEAFINSLIFQEAMEMMTPESDVSSSSTSLSPANGGSPVASTSSNTGAGIVTQPPPRSSFLADGSSRFRIAQPRFNEADEIARLLAGGPTCRVNRSLHT